MRHTPYNVSSPPPFPPTRPRLGAIEGRYHDQQEATVPTDVFPPARKSQIMAPAQLYFPELSHRRRIRRGCHRGDWKKERTCIADVVLDHDDGEPDHNRLCSCVLLSVI